MRKIKDLVIKTGTFKNKDGEEKGRYLNVGCIMEGDKGSFILLDKTFNPAGIQSDNGSVLIHIFDLKEKETASDDFPF